MKKNKIVLILLTLCVFSGKQCYGETGNLLTLADFQRASEDQSVLVTHPFYPDSVWRSWINEGTCDLASYGIVEKLDTIIWVAGTMIYGLNEDFINLVALTPLKPTGKKPLNFIPAKDIGKREEPGATQRPQDFWQSGKGMNAIIGFYPPPAIVDTFLVIYGAEANNLSSDNDTTDIPYSYRSLIIDYVVCRALLREGKKAASDRYWESYMKRLEIKLKFDRKIFDVLIVPKEIKE